MILGPGKTESSMQIIFSSRQCLARFQLAAVVAILTLSLPAWGGDVHPGEDQDAVQTIRVVTFNILGLRGFPVTKGSPIVFPNPSPDLVVELASRTKEWRVDVLVIQEAPPEEVVRELAARCGMNHVFFSTRSQPSADWPFGFPGALLSKWPLSGAVAWGGADLTVGDDLFQRHWGEATVLINDKPLRIAGLHLCADWGGVFRESTRLAELGLLLSTTRADLLAGDFNMRPGSAPWLDLYKKGWRDLWNETGKKTGGMTSDTREPTARIDYFWLAPNSAWKFRKVLVLPNVLVEIDQNPVFLSDHLPVLVELFHPEPGS